MTKLIPHTIKRVCFAFIIYPPNVTKCHHFVPCWATTSHCWATRLLSLVAHWATTFQSNLVSPAAVTMDLPSKEGLTCVTCWQTVSVVPGMTVPDQHAGVRIRPTIRVERLAQGLRNQPKNTVDQLTAMSSCEQQIRKHVWYFRLLWLSGLTYHQRKVQRKWEIGSCSSFHHIAFQSYRVRLTSSSRVPSTSVQGSSYLFLQGAFDLCSCSSHIPVSMLHHPQSM